MNKFKYILKRAAIMSLIVSMAFLTLPEHSVSATSTADELKRVQQEKKDTEKKKAQSEDNIDDLREETDGLKTYLEQLNAQLTDATNELTQIEALINEKRIEISEARTQLEEAKKKEIKQAEGMRVRIKFMYEHSENTYLEMLLSADSFGSFLNMSEYVEKLAAYDKNLLSSYKELKLSIEKLEKELVEEQDSLEALMEQAQEKKDAVSELVKETGDNVKGYMDQISVEEKNLLAYEEALAQQENDEATLQERLAEERALAAKAAQMAMRNLSDITFNAGDIDMMAAIIECEAGGESYTGKVAVGAVVMNRVKSPLFPETVAGVIYQNRQFSPVGSGRFAIVLSRRANDSCYQAAQEAMAGSTPVGNCLFFRTPIPGLTGIQIGGHIFY